MPRYGLDKLLEDEQIADVGRVRAVAVRQVAPTRRRSRRGQKVFAEQCVDLSRADGKGNQEQGAPNLTDGIWLYGGSQAGDRREHPTGRGGMMPAWAGRLDPVTIKSLAVYVHSLGGGK